MQKWLSIYDSIFGPKLRKTTIILQCSEGEIIGILVALWLWGMDHADRDGKVQYNDKEEIARYLYYKDYGTSLDMMKVIDALIDAGWIEERDGCLYLHDWSDWQKVWYDFCEKRDRAAERQRTYREAKKGRTTEEREQTSVPALPEKPRENEQIKFEQDEKSEESLEPKKKKAVSYGEEFEKFWEVYPRKVEKAKAYEKYCARVKSGFSPEELITAATNYASDCRKKHTDSEYIKHPATFLGPSTPFVDWLPKNGNGSNGGGNIQMSGGNPFEQWKDRAEG